MKKLITLALACVALASCSKENEEGVEPNAPVEIKLNAGSREWPVQKLPK